MPKFKIIFLFILSSILYISSVTHLHAQNSDRPVLIISGSETNDFLNEIGKPLLIAAGIEPISVKFHIMRDPSLNAMALPSKDIIFNSGIILRAQSVDEVAGVMAHEIAHLSAGHHSKLKSELKNVSLQTMLLGVAGLTAGMISGNSKVGQASMISSAASGQSIMLANQRQKESQADRLAIRYLAKAGYEPHGLTTFMERIQQEQKSTSMPPQYLLSHPLSSTRVVEIEELANEIRPEKLRPKPKKRTLNRIKAKLLAATTTVPSIAIDKFSNRLNKNPDNFSNRYGLAVAQRYAGKLPESQRQLDSLIIENPEDPYLLRERGRTYIDWGKPAKAQRDFQTALKFHPKSQDLQYWLAFAFKEQKKYKKASRILHRLTNKYPKKASYFYLLGISEGKSGHLAKGHLALGRYYALIRDIKNSIWHFDEAIRLYPQNSAGENNAKAAKRRLIGDIKKIKAR
ncbi:MAG: M48 family metalloprotease [Magnetococcales bacterium]|nr:M48 family metalloprotease [Magnetococcales bacterium]